MCKIGVKWTELEFGLKTKFVKNRNEMAQILSQINERKLYST